MGDQEAASPSINSDGPPGMEVEDINDDAQGRDTALYYKGLDGGTHGPFDQDQLRNWLQRGFFPSNTTFFFDTGLTEEAGTAAELLPAGIDDPPEGRASRPRRPKRKKKKKAQVVGPLSDGLQASGPAAAGRLVGGHSRAPGVRHP